MAEYYISPEELGKLKNKIYCGIIEVHENYYKDQVIVIEKKKWFSLNGILTKIFDN